MPGATCQLGSEYTSRSVLVMLGEVQWTTVLRSAHRNLLWAPITPRMRTESVFWVLYETGT